MDAAPPTASAAPAAAADRAPAVSRDWRPAIRVVGVIALLLLLITILIGPSQPLGTGAVAPVTRGIARDGGAFDLADWRGQPVFVNVWAAWCGPCLMELPELAAAAKKHTDVRFVGLAVDVGDGASTDAVIARFGIPYPNVPIDGVTQAAWNAMALPSSFLVGKDGRVVWSAGGALSAADIEAALALAR